MRREARPLETCRCPIRAACALALLPLLGCSEEPPRMATTVAIVGYCVDDDDCKSNQLCVFRSCGESCADDIECAPHGYCADTGRGRACVRAADNTCVVDGDCLIHQRCSQRYCIAAEECSGATDAGCPDGGDTVQRSGSAGASHAGASASASGASAGSGAAASGGNAPMSSGIPCTPGATLCDGRMVVNCDTHGQARVQRECPFVCTAGDCHGVCKPNTARCVDAAREVCDDNGDWQAAEACSELCTRNGCSGGCVEGTRQCRAGAVSVCRANQWAEEMKCPFVCEGNACGGECTPGAIECRNNAVATCGATGRWSQAPPCSNACVAGACAGVCTPGAQRCMDARMISTCGNDAQWSAPAVCPNQACIDGRCTGECAPSTWRCGSANSIESCSTAGHWQSVTTCVDQVCVQGTCSGACGSGAKRCDPGDAHNIQTCSAMGTWSAPQSCGANSLCVSGECVACTRGQSPDWVSASDQGGNQRFDDPRWGSAEPAMFQSTLGDMSGGYIIVFDRSTSELAVSIRVTRGSSEAPTMADLIYFGITANVGTGAVAREVQFSPPALDFGQGPGVITAFVTSKNTGMWTQDSVTDNSWIRDLGAWRGTQNDTLSWVVSFRVGLAQSDVDPALPFRATITAHLDGAGDLSTPTDYIQLRDRPFEWPAVDVGSIMCVGRAQLMF